MCVERRLHHPRRPNPGQLLGARALIEARNPTPAPLGIGIKVNVPLLPAVDVSLSIKSSAGNGNGNNGGGKGNGNGNNGGGNGNGNGNGNNGGGNGGGNTGGGNGGGNNGNGNGNGGSGNTSSSGSGSPTTSSQANKPTSNAAAPKPTQGANTPAPQPVPAPSSTTPTQNNPGAGNSGGSGGDVPNGSSTLAGQPTEGSSDSGVDSGTLVSGTSVPTPGAPQNFGAATGNVDVDLSSDENSLPSRPVPNSRPAAPGSSGSSGLGEHAPVVPASITTVSGGKTVVIPNPDATAPGTLPAPTPTSTSRPDDPGHKKGLPTGALVAIILALLLLLLCLFLVFLRRRIKARRNNRAGVWWFNRKRSSKEYSDEVLVEKTVEVIPSGVTRRPSQRSSFATTFDRSLAGSPNFSVNFTQDMPALPPLAEVRRSQNMFNYPMPPSDCSGATGENAEQRRLSGGSASSRDSAWLFVSKPNETSLPEPRDSMGTFSFPQLPPGALTPNGSMTPGRVTPRLSHDPFASASKLTVLPPRQPSEPCPHTEQNPNPFSDPDPTINHNYNYYNFNSNNGNYNEFEAELGSSSTHTIDPFSASTISTIHGDFNEIEIVRRSFTSTRFDELSVESGDQLRVLKVFDDGWVLVQKAVDDGKVVAERGLIPVDCFREAGQDWNSFLLAKRIDSVLPISGPDT